MTVLPAIGEEMAIAHGASSGARAASTEFLPYAIALEVREPWGDHLAEACVVTTITR